MATNALNGKDLVIKVGNGASPEVFTTVAALKTAKVDLSRSSVDITNKDSAGWQEMLNTASIASGKITGSGIFSNAATQETIRASFFSGASKNFQIIDGDGNKLQGGFVCTAYSRSGGYNDADTYDITLDSNGVIVYTAGS